MSREARGVSRLGAVRWAVAWMLFVASGVAAASAVAAGPASRQTGDWSAAGAAEVQESREIDSLSVERPGDPRGGFDLESDFVSKRTGLGTLPPPADPRLLERQRVQAEIEALELRLQLLARDHSVAAAVSVLQGAQPKSSSSTRMQLRTDSGISPTDGYVYLIAEGQPIQAIWIDPQGRIDLPLAVGDVFGLLALPLGPFGAQFVGGLRAEAEGMIALRDSRRVPLITVVDDGSSYTGAYQLVVTVETSAGSLGTSRQVDRDSDGVGLWLAEGARSRLEVRLEAPYLLDSAPSLVSASDASIQIVAVRGFLLQIRMQDPDGLLQGCRFSGYASTGLVVSGEHSHLWSYAYNSERNGEQHYLLGVPRGLPVEVRTSHVGGQGYCSIEEFELPARRYFADTSLPVRIARSPSPVIQVADEDGAALPWTGAFFLETSSPWRTHYVSADFTAHTGLSAGSEYEVQLVTDDRIAPRVRVVAQSGEFPVRLNALSRADVTTRMLTPEEGWLTGVLEAYREGQLILATQIVQNSPLTLRIPSGEYEFRLIGVGGDRRLPNGAEYVGVALKPILFTRTIEPGPQVLDIDLPAPESGVRFDVSTLPGGLHATLHQGDQPVVALPIRSWYSGILTDLPVIDAVLRGAGLDGTRVQWQPEVSLPSVSFADSQGPYGRLRGRLLDASGTPLAFRYITQSSDAVVQADFHWTDAEGRFDLPKMRGARYWFSSPVWGDSLFEEVVIDDPSGDTTADIVLDRVALHDINPGASGPQLLYGTGDRAFRVVFLAEGYSGRQESFTDLNGNGVWDGWLFIDENDDGLWQETETVRAYGSIATQLVGGTDITLGNEPFVDLNGDGYPSVNDRAVFDLNARHYVRALLGSREIREGIEFDAYLLFVDSNQAGMDIEGRNGELILARDTAFGARYERTRGLLTVDYARVSTVLRENIDRWDLQVVMINQPFPMGRANSFILATGGIGVTDPNNLVAGHEFAHNPGGLDDEYSEFSAAYSGQVPRRSPNVTDEVEPAVVPWADLIEDRADLPIALPNSYGTGLYAGAYYRPGGAYRSSMSSRMSNLAVQFNEASRRGMAEAFCRAGLRLVPESPPESAAPAERVFAAGFEPTYEDYVSPCP